MNQVRKCRRDKYKKKEFCLWRTQNREKKVKSTQIPLRQIRRWHRIVSNKSWEFKGDKGNLQVWSSGSLYERGYNLYGIGSCKRLLRGTMKRNNTWVLGKNRNKVLRVGEYRKCSEKINYLNYLKGRGMRRRVGEKPGTTGAIINVGLINESVDADLVLISST